MNQTMYDLIKICLVILITITPASATNLTYTDISCLNSGAGTCSSSIYVYNINGSLSGILNSTGDSVMVGDNESINLFLKPNAVSLLNNPTFTLQWILNSWNMFFTILLVMGVIVAMFYTMKKMFFRGEVAPIGATPSNKDQWKTKRWGK